jgi:hypothetical protein
MQLSYFCDTMSECIVKMKRVSRGGEEDGGWEQHIRREGVVNGFHCFSLASLTLCFPQ